MFNNQAAKIRTHLSNLMIAINLLNNNRISTYLLPYEVLQNTISNITHILETNYTDYKLVSKDVSFYYKYNQYSYARWNNTLFITLKFPITSHIKFENYQVKTFHLPISPVDISNTNANILANPPKYFSISHTEKLYTVFSTNFKDDCQEYIDFDICNNELTFKTFEENDCYLELFWANNSKKILKLCDHLLEKKVIKPSFQILDESQIIIYHVPKFNITCNGTIQEKIGCIFCLMDIPCGCKIFTKYERLLSHNTLCKQTNIDIETIYPINVPLIQYFF